MPPCLATTIIVLVGSAIMHDLIQTATAELAGFLLAHLPALGDDWWTTHVEEHLSFQQQRMVQERGLRTLDQLDFAALLRVFDRNWYELSQALNLPREGRNWARELQTVRNKWAHLSAQTMPASDVYRDADTLGRFLVMLGAKRRPLPRSMPRRQLLCTTWPSPETWYPVLPRLWVEPARLPIRR